MSRKTVFWTMAIAVCLLPSLAAADCKADIQDIDQTIASIDLSDADKEKAMELRNDAEAQCQAGKEREAGIVIAQVRELLDRN